MSNGDDSAYLQSINKNSALLRFKLIRLSVPAVRRRCRPKRLDDFPLQPRGPQAPVADHGAIAEISIKPKARSIDCLVIGAVTKLTNPQFLTIAVGAQQSKVFCDPWMEAGDCRKGQGVGR